MSEQTYPPEVPHYGQILQITIAPTHSGKQQITTEAAVTGRTQIGGRIIVYVSCPLSDDEKNGYLFYENRQWCYRHKSYGMNLPVSFSITV